jgi:hypothetical protein
MTDYGHDLEFGYFLIPDAGDPLGVLETARLADRLGYDLLAVQDHPYQAAHLDTLALLGVILGQTERTRGPRVRHVHPDDAAARRRAADVHRGSGARCPRARRDGACPGLPGADGNDRELMTTACEP